MVLFTPLLYSLLAFLPVGSSFAVGTWLSPWLRTEAIAEPPDVEIMKLSGRSSPFPVPLTICCVGDSITAGVGSEGDNAGDSYRLYLYNMITQAGTSVNFVGKQTGMYQPTTTSGLEPATGNDPEPDNEAVGGYRIDQIITLLEQDNTITSQQPNVVLIHAGTNDNALQFVYQDGDQTCADGQCVGNAHATETYADAPNRLGNLIDYVLCHQPNAIVLVAILIQDYYNSTQGNLFNAEVPNVVAARYEKGYKVRVVDMSSVSPAFDQKVHPDNDGYQEMANRWYTAMLDIPSSWWTTNSNSKRADSSSTGPVQTCTRDAVSFSAALNGGVVAAGWHVSSDPGEPPSTPENTGNLTGWIPQWGDDGDIAIGSGYPGEECAWPILTEMVRVICCDSSSHTFMTDSTCIEGLTDYLWVNFSDASVRAWLNKGSSGGWVPVNNANRILWGTGNPDYVEFADLTGDKKVEYIVIDNGAFRVFQNDGPNGDVWTFGELVEAGSQITNVFGSGGVGLHYFADMNGDGLADLAVLNNNGVVDFYIQQGKIGTDGFSWTPCLNHAELTGLMALADIDGDGRADYASIADDGSMSGWLNTPGGTCDITWVAINGRGPDSLQFSKGAPSDAFRLADINGDGKADYLTVSNDTGQLNSYPNKGYFGTKDNPGIGGYGAAVRLADINGDGVDDYLSVDDATGVLAYVNGGQQGSSWSWTEQNNGQVIALGYSGASRSEIHFADMNGDGFADFLFIDSDTGAIHCYLNFGPDPQTGWNFTILDGDIAIGVGGQGAGVRMADIDGDGKADYIYLDDDGAARVWINADDTLRKWVPLNNGNVAALGVGANRDDVQFADVDGDGRADYIWVHPEDGSAEVWYNGGPTGPNGDALAWYPGGTIQQGVGYPGQNIRFARIGTSGRADYVALSDDGSFKAWLSSCSNVTGSSGRAGSAACSTNVPLPPSSGPEAPYTAAMGAGCITAPCTACFGPGCGGACGGQQCSTCSGAACGGCKGNDCNTCTGPDCDGCHGYECTVCSGSDCTASCQGSDCGSPSPTPSASPALPPNTTPSPATTAPPATTEPATTISGIVIQSNVPGTGRIVPVGRDNWIWAGLGDSYSAAPGAGNVIETPGVPTTCKQRDGSYVVQTGKMLERENTYFFYSCLGAKTPDVVNVQVPMLQEQPLLDFALLSIGGNNVGFSNVLRNCLLFTTTDEACNAAIDRTSQIIDDPGPDGLNQQLQSAWSAVSTRIRSWKPVIIQESYPSFFDIYDDDTWCDGQTLNVVMGTSEPKLTSDLRSRLNTLSTQMSTRLVSYVNAWNRAAHPGYARVLLSDYYGTGDTIYGTHRFCRYDVHDLDDSSIWIFKAYGYDVTTAGVQLQSTAGENATLTAQQVESTWDASTCAQDPQYDTWSDFMFGCEYALLLASGNVSSDTVFGLPEFLSKVFHPKSVAYTEIAEYTSDYTDRYIAPPAIATGSDSFIPQNSNGLLQCFPPGPSYNNDTTYVSSSAAKDAIEDFCGAALYNAAVANGAYGDFGGMRFQISVDDSLEDNCTALDPTNSYFYGLCGDAFEQMFACDPPPSGQDAAYQGGAFYKSCVTWSFMKCPTEGVSDCFTPPFPPIGPQGNAT
ncbi:carbohydrate esterase family 3 protein [Zasmidium cellare ATCC 36951]|uniref:Carbohydrate esterase family 3 protein n=1 Tax=Zasmidium cellare ATCC 36951 TaxID=1080233 RepID=A0A6A6D1F9_ZASCE|nr:carbohydrate esterase family 3 protein [Zasmidium cellare ATCC 36951]KAF2172258.1 carbohydrate esterase family 3 protein [Zasmidium cellare ATCC 36951]